MKWYWDNYTSNQTNRKEPIVSPLQASIEELKGLPPALIINGEFDVLRGVCSQTDRCRGSGEGSSISWYYPRLCDVKSN
jgi:acetyl esterase/lipase